MSTKFNDFYGNMMARFKEAKPAPAVTEKKGDAPSQKVGVAPAAAPAVSPAPAPAPATPPAAPPASK